MRAVLDAHRIEQQVGPYELAWRKGDAVLRLTRPRDLDADELEEAFGGHYFAVEEEPGVVVMRPRPVPVTRAVLGGRSQ